MAATVADAAPTLFQYTLPMMEPSRPLTTRAIWEKGFELTYAAELRAERGGRPGAIVDSEPHRYDRFGDAALAHIAELTGVGPNGEVALLASSERMARWWRKTRWRGKALTLVRLAKATTTFAGGVDYIAWKINRHAGTAIEVKPWQRRWPILGALTLLPRLWRRGAIR